ncbi:MAG: hypothetical protein ACJ786_24810 [Catenulispora sp.]
MNEPKKRTARVLAALALAVGTLAVPVGAASTASAATCNQPSHAWIVSNYGNLPPGNFSIPGSANLTFTGVLEPGWGVLFQYYTPNGDPNTGAGFIYNNLEGSANSNCVLNQRSHQASFIPYVGQMKVYAYYRAWETNSDVLTFLGYFTKTS